MWISRQAFVAKALMTVFALWTALLPAAAGAAGAGLSAAVARYVDDATLAVVRVDVATLDAGAVADFLKANTPPDADAAEAADLAADVRKAVAEVKAALAPTTAAGVTRAYLLVTAATLVRREPPVVVVPVAGEGQRAAVLASPALGRMAGEVGLAVTGEAGGAVVLAAPGAARALAAFKAVARPDLAGLFDGDEKAAVVVGFVPTPLVRMFAAGALRQQVQQNPGVLPAGVVDVAQGLGKARMTLSLPPGAGTTLRAEFADAATAGKAAKLAGEGVEYAKKELADNGYPASAGTAMDALRPKADAAALTTRVEGAEVKPVAQLLVGALLAARQSAKLTVGLANLRQIAVATLMYANDKGGVMPSSLADLRPYLDPDDAAFARLTTSPRFGPTSKIVLLRPAETLPKVRNAATVLTYEPPPAGYDGSVAVGFFDGHCEAVTVERLEALAKEQGFIVERSGK